MHRIPLVLIYSRLIAGLLLLGISFLQFESYAIISISLITFGLLSDIFDGIIARKLNVSSQKLRRLDSSIDQVFWCLIAASAYIKYPDFFIGNYVKLGILGGLELLTYVVSYWKFRKEVATHAIASKIWALTIFATLVQLFSEGSSEILFSICFYVGIMTRMEIILILLLLKEWINDVPSVYHAWTLRKGLPIKRNKLFNG